MMLSNNLIKTPNYNKITLEPNKNYGLNKLAEKSFNKSLKSYSPNIINFSEETFKKVRDKQESLIINQLVNALPVEALALLKNIIYQYNDSENKSLIRYSDLYKSDQKVNNSNDEESNKLIRAKSLAIKREIGQKRALELFKNAKTEEERLTIYESGVVLGLIVGISTRKDLVEIMKNHSTVIYDIDSLERILFYDDIGVTVFLNPQDIITEIQFGIKFKGHTFEGLKVGDNLDQAIKLYGEPRMKSAKAALWNYFSIFYVNKRIRCIRIQS